MGFKVISEDVCKTCHGRGTLPCEGVLFERLCLDCDGSGVNRSEIPLQVALSALGLFWVGNSDDLLFKEDMSITLQFHGAEAGGA